MVYIITNREAKVDVDVYCIDRGWVTIANDNV